MDLLLPPLQELLDDYEDQLQELRSCLPVDKRRSVDNLFLLRYLVSFSGPSQAAADAVAKALEWREKHGSLVQAARECTNELDSSPLQGYMKADHLRTLDSCLVASYGGATERPPGFPIYVIQSGRCALRELMSQVPIESVALWLTWRNEIGFWRCDAASRQKCCLVKQMVVMNLAECRLMDQDPRFFVAYGRSSKRSEYLHPQLLARLMVLNPPSFMSYFWALGRRLLSERLLRKVYVHSGAPEEHLAGYFDGTQPAELLARVTRQSANGDRQTRDSEDAEQEMRAGEAAVRWVESTVSDQCLEVPLPAAVLKE